MTSGDSACGGKTAPVRVIESNSVVELKATPELPLAVVLRDLRRKGACETAGDCGSACTVFRPVKELPSECVKRCGGWDRENWLLCWHRSCFSTRKAGRKDRRREGSM